MRKLVLVSEDFPLLTTVPNYFVYLSRHLGGIEDVSFNEWLDAIDGSYCTSQGGDDFTYDPQLPSPFPGGFADHSCGTIPNATRPLVVSNSQAAHEYLFSGFYLERQCNEFAKLGLMGVSVLYSAGNTGVAGMRGYCLDDNGVSFFLSRFLSIHFKFRNSIKIFLRRFVKPQRDKFHTQLACFVPLGYGGWRHTSQAQHRRFEFLFHSVRIEQNHHLRRLAG